MTRLRVDRYRIKFDAYHAAKNCTPCSAYRIDGTCLIITLAAIRWKKENSSLCCENFFFFFFFFPNSNSFYIWRFHACSYSYFTPLYFTLFSWKQSTYNNCTSWLLIATQEAGSGGTGRAALSKLIHNLIASSFSFHTNRVA